MAKRELTPRDRELIKRRIEFVRSKPNLDPAEARKRFFVQTRAQELKAAGKPVDRKALRQQYESGKVKRQGFYTEGDLKRIAARTTTTTTTSTTTPKPYTERFTPQQQILSDIGRKYTPPRATTTPTGTSTGGGGSWVNRAAARVTGAVIGGVKDVASGKAARSAVKGAAGYVYGASESLAATFTNPLINQASRAATGRNVPGLREASPTERAVTTGLTAIDIVSVGGARPLTSAARTALLRTLERTATNQYAVGAKVALANARQRAANAGAKTGLDFYAAATKGSLSNVVDRISTRGKATTKRAATKEAAATSTTSATRTAGGRKIYKKPPSPSAKRKNALLGQKGDPDKIVVVTRKKDNASRRVNYAEISRPRVDPNAPGVQTWEALRGRSGTETAGEMRSLISEGARQKKGDVFRTIIESDYGVKVRSGKPGKKLKPKQAKAAKVEAAPTKPAAKAAPVKAETVEAAPVAKAEKRSQGTNRASKKNPKGTEAKQASAAVKPSSQSSDIAAARQEMQAEGFDFGDSWTSEAAALDVAPARIEAPKTQKKAPTKPAAKQVDAKAQNREAYARRQQKKTEKAAGTTPAVGSAPAKTARQAAETGPKGTSRASSGDKPVKRKISDIRSEAPATPEQKSIASGRGLSDEAKEQISRQSAEKAAESARGTGRSINKLREESKQAEQTLKAQQVLADTPRGLPGRNKATEGVDWADVAINESAPESEVFTVLKTVKIPTAEIYEREWQSGIGRNLLARVEGILSSPDPARRGAAANALSEFSKRNRKVLGDVSARDQRRKTLEVEIKEAARFDRKIRARRDREVRRVGGSDTPEGKAIIRRYNKIRGDRAAAGAPGGSDPSRQPYYEYIRSLELD